MSNLTSLLQNLFENKPLYSPIILPKKKSLIKTFELKEIQGDCSTCGCSKPFHNLDSHNRVGIINFEEDVKTHVIEFKCVTCDSSSLKFWVRYCQLDDVAISLEKIGQFPQKELPKSKALSKFFLKDKNEYNKAIVCIANGYGVAAYAYLRRIVERNIFDLIELIQEEIDENSPIFKTLQELKSSSPMSDRIGIANKALPDYLKPDGFNPLGQIYGLLSDGVHSLSEEECLEKAENIQACLEFLISELATHKKNKEEFKKRLIALKGK